MYTANLLVLISGSTGAPILGSLIPLGMAVKVVVPPPAVLLSSSPTASMLPVPPSSSWCSLAVQGAVSYNLLSSDDSLSGKGGISSSTVAYATQSATYNMIIRARNKSRQRKVRKTAPTNVTGSK